MNPIQTNRPVFFGNNGEVLKSGMIYIGQPDQWPISFPKTVTLQDSVGTQFTAVQPLRTNNQGRIASGGQAVIALVNGDYSMLVRDVNGVTVNDGYTPFIANEAEDSEVSGVTQVGLLLSDIKQFDVTPGETVRNVGKLTTLDNLGADWLVVSNTGNPEDDVDLIDFANGAQGRRVQNYAALSGGSSANFSTMPNVGGDPIVESGSNSDGEWVRWADGTQYCEGNESTSITDATWTFPVAFIARATRSATPASGADGNISAFFRNDAAVTSSDVAGYSSSGGRLSLSVDLLAFGRWK